MSVAEEAQASVRVGWRLQELTGANHEWSPDFTQGVIAAGRMIRVLNVVAAFTRECLAQKGGCRLRQPSRDVGTG